MMNYSKVKEINAKANKENFEFYIGYLSDELEMEMFPLTIYQYAKLARHNKNSAENTQHLTSDEFKETLALASLPIFFMASEDFSNDDISFNLIKDKATYEKYVVMIENFITRYNSKM